MNKLTLAGLLCFLISIKGYTQIGFGTATPNSSLHVAGSLAINVRSFSANSTATSTDYTLIFTGTSASSLTLPNATTCTGRSYWIKNGSATIPTPALTIITTASQTIDGNAGWVLDEPKEVIEIESDGAGWKVYSQNTPISKTSTLGSAWVQGGNDLSAIKSLGTISNYGFGLSADNSTGMFLNTSGFLGVGTTNPLGRLHFVNENNESGNDYIFTDYGGAITGGPLLRKSRGTEASPLNLQNGDLIGQYRFAGRYNGSLVRDEGAGIDAYYLGNGTTNLSDLRIFASDVEVIRMNSLGSVGVGATAFDASNAEELLVDAGNTLSYNVISGKGEINSYLQLNIQNTSSGSTASTDIVASADNATESVNYIDFGINSSGYSSLLVPIVDGINEAYLFSTGADFKIGNGSSGYDLAFFTNGFNSTDEKIRILASGKVGIGTTTPGEKLTIAGNLTPSADNTYTLGKNGARWTSVWSANGTISTSDSRMKTNIRSLEYGMKELKSVRPVSYNWKESPNSATKIGLLAQQIQKLMPEVIAGGDENGFLGMNYSDLIPVLINTIKQQQQQLAKLRKDLETLSGK